MERKRREENVSRVWKDEEEEEKVNLFFFFFNAGNDWKQHTHTEIHAHLGSR